MPQLLLAKMTVPPAMMTARAPVLPTHAATNVTVPTAA